MAEDSDLEKTEEPSQRKLEKAREEGQIARSRELSTFAVTLTGGLILWLMGQFFVEHLVRLMQDGLTWERDVSYDMRLILPRFFELSVSALLTFLPLMGAVLVAALFSPVLINGWLFSLKSLEPKLSKLDPISGFARMFSMQSLAELIKAVGKTLIIGVIAAMIIWNLREDMLGLALLPLSTAIAEMGRMIAIASIAIIGSMLIIVAMDVPFQIWEFRKKMRMTKEEVRQEAKETEGDPMVKGRIRALQREAARRRMMEAIPTADVVVTNPTHYSVALKYTESGMRAPVVVAKGSHLLALRIREIAQEHNVPMLEAPPLARALHKHTELGDSIPEALYTAVAEVLAYVYQLKQYQRQGGNMPRRPENLPVPEGMDPGVEPEVL